MSFTYASKKKTEKAAPGAEAASQGPSLEALRTGAASPTAAQLGHRVDLPEAMRSKMENAFGADLSAVRLYESQTVAEAGAEAVTRGRDIAFAPGMLDFSSFGGQALLGHELSHVVSQARGEVSQSGGFLNDRALEARADREGAMAAAGQTVAAPAAALSMASAAPAAGPMQASKAEHRIDKHQRTQMDSLDTMMDLRSQDPQNYMRNKDYLAAESKWRSAQKRENYWRGKLSPNARQPQSTGMRMLTQRIGRTGSMSEFDRSRQLLDIIGTSDNDLMGALDADSADALKKRNSELSAHQRNLSAFSQGGQGGNFTRAFQDLLRDSADSSQRDRDRLENFRRDYF